MTAPTHDIKSLLGRARTSSTPLRAPHELVGQWRYVVRLGMWTDLYYCWDCNAWFDRDGAEVAA